MTQQKHPGPQVSPPAPHDPYKLRTLEQILTIFDGGEFLFGLLRDHQKLLADMLDHRADHPGMKATGSMTLTLKYVLGENGDTAMHATREFKAPKKPPSTAGAYITEQGELTLYSPMMARMQRPVRDLPDHDPETGEIRDV